MFHALRQPLFESGRRSHQISESKTGQQEKRNGFTLLELMMVIAIIAVLAVLGIASIQAANKAARDTQRRDNIKTIKTALESYKIANKVYPENPDPYSNAYYLTCSDPCLSGDPLGPSGPLNSYITGDLRDPTGPSGYEDPGNLKWTSNPQPQTFRYFYNKDSSSTYTLRLATEATCPNPDKTSLTDCANSSDSSKYEDFSMQ